MIGSAAWKLVAKVARHLLRRAPPGFTLLRADGIRHNRIRGDLIPVGSLVIVQDDRCFVRTGELDDVGFDIHREGHKTHVYRSWS